ncbi:MAG TPA: PAS domain S-box protein, partial [Chloroflexia bacterium]|nr:PAS domain S-box protein [Chloroflexia bacterium]
MISRVLDPDNYALSIYMAPTLITGAAVLLLGGLVLLRERVTRVSLSFALLTFTVAIWLTAFSFMYVSADEQVALFWARAGYLGVPFIASATHTFASSVLKYYRPPARLVLLSWTLMGAASLGAAWDNVLIVEMRRYSWGYYPIFGWLGALFVLVFCGILVASLLRFWLEFRRSPPSRHRRRISWLMVAFSAGYVGAVDFVPVFGVPLYPFGYLPIFAFILLAAYAVWVYRLVDITPAFAANQIIETMSEALLVLDSAGVIRLVNRAARDLFGYSSAELVGKPLAAAARGADFPPQLYQLERSDTIEDLEMPFFNREGDLRTITLSASTTQEKRPEDRALVLVARDVTESK